MPRTMLPVAASITLWPSLASTSCVAPSCWMKISLGMASPSCRHQLLERHGFVGEPRQIDPRLGRDELFRQHEFLRATDGVGGDDLAVADVEGREVALLLRIAAQHDLVVAGGNAGHLQLEVVLVRQEPR